MNVRSICILSTLGLLGLVLAVQASHAQSMTPGQAAPPLPTLDLTKPGSPRPSAMTQRPPTQAAAPAPAAPAAAAPAPRPTVAKAPTTTTKTAKATKVTKGKPAKGKPVAAAKPHKKVTTKASAKTAKIKPAGRPTTQTAIAGDR